MDMRIGSAFVFPARPDASQRAGGDSSRSTAAQRTAHQAYAQAAARQRVEQHFEQQLESRGNSRGQQQAKAGSRGLEQNRGERVREQSTLFDLRMGKFAVRLESEQDDLDLDAAVQQARTQVQSRYTTLEPPERSGVASGVQSAQSAESVHQDATPADPARLQQALSAYGRANDAARNLATNSRLLLGVI